MRPQTRKLARKLMRKVTRRKFVENSAVAGLALGAAMSDFMSGGVRASLAANPRGEKLHGLSAFGELKYGPDYSHFDYANPDAPEGGLFSFSPSNWGYNQNIQTFNTLNSFVLKGASPPRMELCFDTLMVRAIDEPDAVYCSLAKSVEISADGNSYIFSLRDQARFHDGSVLTAEDVVFSYKIIKQKGHPQLSQDMTDLEEIRQLDGNRVEVKFNGKQSARAILAIAGSTPIFSKVYYSGRKFDSSNLDVPLASGPWRVGRFSPGQFIEYERVDDYWAKELPFARGLNHFDKLRLEFYSERVAAFEAFKKGDILWREEFTSKVWATEYDFPAVDDGRVVRKLFSDELRPSMQGWALNTRRAKFTDIKVRQAIGLCFDFEWTNKNLFYSAYTRSQSLFESSAFKAEGKPDTDELALLNSLTGELPDGIFGEPAMQPASNGSGNDRDNLRKAFALLIQAGWQSKNSKLVDANGRQFTIEFLVSSKAFEKVLGGMTANLRQLGIRTSIRQVDPSQYQARVDSFDFDIIVSAFSISPSPTAEGMRKFFHSQSSDINGSRNMPGIRVQAIDELIDSLAKVKTRKQLNIVMRCLDRVLRAHAFWIPNWYSTNHRVAMWDMFGWSEPKPDFGFPVESIWWLDQAKAKLIGKG